MAIKLQISSLAVLERVIGGDTEIEVDIRNSVVQSFTNKHLKSLVSAAFSSQIAEIKQTLAAQAEAQMTVAFGEMRQGSDRWQKPYMVLNQQTKEALALGALNAVSPIRAELIQTVEKRVIEMIASRFTEDRINTLIEQTFKNGVQDIILAKVEARLQALKDSL